MYKKITTIVLLASILAGCGRGISNNISSDSPDNTVNIASKFSTSGRDVVSIIKKANEEYQKRNPEIINLKYKSMRASAFAFYRTTGYLFYSDIANASPLSSNINIPISGDLHLENIGTYHTSNEKVSYDLNDFDDSVTGPYTWDLARCAVSIFLAADENNMDKDTRKELVDSFINSYINKLRFLQKNNSALSQPISHNDLSKDVAKVVDNVASFSYSNFIADIAPNSHFKFNDKFNPVSNDIAGAITQAINSYAVNKKRTPGFFRVKSIASHIAGKASLGRYRYTVLIEGSTTRNEDDIILELKESAQPIVASALGNINGNQAQRVIQAEKYFHVSSDPYLGITRINNIDFVIREIFPDDKVDLTKLDKKSEFKEFLDTAALVAARAHARSGKISQILADSDNLSHRINSFAEEYAKQVKDDYDIFRNS